MWGYTPNECIKEGHPRVTVKVGPVICHISETVQGKLLVTVIHTYKVTLVLKLRHLGASVVEVRPILSATKLAPKSALNDFWCYYQMLLRTRTELCGPRVCVCVS